MTKRFVIVITALVVVFGGIFAFNVVRSVLIRHFIKTFQLPPAVISADKAVSENWQPTLSAVGSLTAVNSVNVSSEVSGMVTAIRFKSGEMVAQGSSLIQLDDSVDVQDLNNNQADLNLAKFDFARRSSLLKSGAVSQSEYDQALAKLKQAQAMVNKSLVLIGKKNIRAPFAGKIGIRRVNIGQYITPGDALVSLQSLDPLFVDFSLPEQDLKFLQVGQEISIQVDAYPGQKFNGVITAIDSQVMQATRSINIRATIPNKDFRLYPGIYADVTLYLPQKKSVVTVTQTAVSYSLYGNTVYVVKAEGKDKKGQPILRVYQRVVKVGEMKDNKVVIEDGITAGEMVVTSGQNKLQEGAEVVINNTAPMNPLPTNNLNGN